MWGYQYLKLQRWWKGTVCDKILIENPKKRKVSDQIEFL